MARRQYSSIPGLCLAIGIFPEGGIARPPGVLREFQTGVGFLVRKSRATVLPVWLEGMPEVDVAISGRWRCGCSS